jgi:uncharacterized protein YmfQ (DUF2313 family)
MQWLGVFKHLLPNARAWRITIEKQLRQFFEGLSELPSDVRSFLDDIFDDIDPYKTRQLSEWEAQFGLPPSAVLTDGDRRDRLDATWRAQGGQNPRYIEDTLRAAGFDVYVHEWWAPTGGTPAGGSVDGDVTPVARNPFTYLWDGVSAAMFVGCGHDDAYCNSDTFFSNSNDTPPGFPLTNNTLPTPVIPADPTKYPYFLYIGGATFPDQAVVTATRRAEFETLCLRIKPTEQWLGMLITYT